MLPALLFPPKISLIHASRKRPERALACREAWLKAAEKPRRVEHIFAVDMDDEASQKAMAPLKPKVMTEDGKGCVGAWNLAASASTGSIMVQLSDDWLPVPGWDEEFRRRLRDVRYPSVLRISDGYRRDDLLCMAIMTRARMKQQGHFFHPNYLGLYSDDEFSFRAYQDGVVIEARDMIILHDHPSFNTEIKHDETYLAQNSLKRGKHGRKVFLKRNPMAEGHWLHPNSDERIFIPKPFGEKWKRKR
jgi:hypothetical protein